jgi:short-subunit dehydrogenase
MADQMIQRIALVTGANKGIGYEVARKLASREIKVLIGARDERRGKEAATKLQSEGLNTQYLHLDIRPWCCTGKFDLFSGAW